MWFQKLMACTTVQQKMSFQQAAIKREKQHKERVQGKSFSHHFVIISHQVPGRAWGPGRGTRPPQGGLAGLQLKAGAERGEQ